MVLLGNMTLLQSNHPILGFNVLQGLCLFFASCLFHPFIETELVSFMKEEMNSSMLGF